MTATSADSMLRELEPSVERLLNRHLNVAQDWLPHQYVPWGEAGTSTGLGR